MNESGSDNKVKTKQCTDTRLYYQIWVRQPGSAAAVHSHALRAHSITGRIRVSQASVHCDADAYAHALQGQAHDPWTVQPCSSHAAKRAEHVCCLGLHPIVCDTSQSTHSHAYAQVVGAAHVQPAPTERARGQMQLVIACPWNSIHCEHRDTRHLRPATSLTCATQTSCKSARKDPRLRCHGRSVFQRRGLSPPSDGHIKPARGLPAASWLSQSCTGFSSHIV